jgi:predicted  nucleic acid-binding Zn-ribbon protein
MKNWLQNLLILFSFSLCVLLAVQWYREDVLRRNLQRSDNTARTVSETISSLQSDVARLEAEAARVEGLRQQLSTNTTVREQEVRALQAALTKANDNIRVQNDALKTLAEERGEIVERYNQLAEDYNNLLNRWTAQQAALTNAVRSLQ